MDCERARELIMGFLDDELSAEERTALVRHLEGCEPCRRDERVYRRLGEMTDRIEFVEPTEAEWRAHWRGTYNRLERGTGWILLSLGAMLLLGAGCWWFLEDFLLNEEISLVVRVGVGSLTAGLVVLLVSTARERIRLYRVDRYNEVEL